ncbi:Lrp/AsnC family transcriptional regulator [Psychromonas sp. SR45-3]|uniref:Lrp/AsnC family transcriptional regulator n=1 Tax=Psychromonas sp. SR45-3 TaxID=2760930 RepID=UPI001C725639|nr:Lrp/AsnC family transcriptional regulator [Psychromonas sp. SR45-3]
MDNIDLKILHQLQTDARASIAEIAAQIGLSEPACYRRVRELRKSGVIEKEMAIIKPKNMGWPLSMMLLVELERDHSTIVNAFLSRINKQPEIIDSWFVTGDYDLVLQVIAADMEAFDQFTQQVLHKDNSVKNFKTLVVMRHSKAHGPIPPAKK